MELLFLDITVYITEEKRTQKGSNQLQVCNTAGSSLRPLILPRFTPCVRTGPQDFQLHPFLHKGTMSEDMK
ncbi:hypothetical protein NC653_022344 [Populus alba x Populus x berolinensis]|uniref:Uncharacterized protein n=1 Tax=Populus alba x Populus x berolinensis TaxID=444605 RepID=A0AAD6Q9N8_9ROSI|nr:hypothetical protein NC653_022344 [Populus alba x Populus x berolinensis]